MRCSACSGQVTIANTTTLVTVKGTSSRSPRLAQIILACSDTPADNTHLFAIRHFTTDGTGTAGTVLANDRNLGAPSCSTTHNYTAEPTYDTGNFVEIPVNQRGFVTWFPPNDADYLAKAGSSNGWGVQCISAAAAVKYNVTIVWDE